MQHRLLHYRQAFFDRLQSACVDRHIELRLVHGQPSAFETLKKDVGHLPWADVVRNRFWRIGGADLVWQPFPAVLRDADLVVLMQENRLLSNYPWLLRLGVGANQRVAYWGHGRNLQSASPNGLRERWKRWFVNRVDWWFAYTDLTRSILCSDGYPSDRITVLNNAIDNDQFIHDLSSVSPERLQACRERIYANPGAPIGLYCGSLYPDKRLDLLIAAADIVHAQYANFRLVVVGDGPSRSLVTSAAAVRPWLHWVGVQRGVDKAAWFRLANAYLSPGAVGLHVLDAFCAGIPMITTVAARHGPEIAYLQSGRNGYVVEADARIYSETYLGLLRAPARLEQIRTTAMNDANRYSLDCMVARYLDGIERCLAMPR
jgi:L-malate glycosyltransferase